MDRGETWAIIPQEGEGLAELLKKRKCVFVLLFVRSIETNNDVVKIIDLADMLDDFLERWALKLGKQTG